MGLSETSDDVRARAEAYIDSCIALFEQPPLPADRERAIRAVEQWTRLLIQATSRGLSGD